ncbi:hypothetical protein ACU6T4_11305 [Avibacterium paragallinarum]|uniref:hypothetical protein n=1 Tax=Avibacterium paragallinarum TaxID=728 RepID=UPI000551BF63|nr:hypothetical protein [Avibacterium paragallinarum]AZI13302.1 hypothetical protein EIA51_00765 [Avibacterium paragallinarum]QIR12767.1 hypothetical protein HBL79_11425 [Avibacterium paragallinarum]QJE10721.1 hypothetical protein HHJ62_10740 [Avibacterium paragallinarum]QJE12914.1 hypothetical protein HHJ61_10740 [Avibacterium paragallinarum]QJE15117.1 hypothetical protein HHJ60_10770 [Avibacterium paragallinarum]
MKTTLQEIKALSEQISAELKNLSVFPYFYETLAAFNLGETHSEKLGRLNAMAQIEQVYLHHIESLQEKLNTELNKLAVVEVKL